MNEQLVIKTILDKATKEEIETFLYLANEYKLDPMKKEMYFIKYGTGKGTIVISRDGFLKIANSNPEFDGIEGDVVYKGDTLTRREDGSILITYSPEHLSFNKDEISGAFCNVWRKDRTKATSVFVSWVDYYKQGNQIWNQYRNSMILKVAESMALKRAFVVNGVDTGDLDEGKIEMESISPKVSELVESKPTEIEVISFDQEEVLQLELRGHPEYAKKIMDAYNTKTLFGIPKKDFKMILEKIKAYQINKKGGIEQ